MSATDPVVIVSAARTPMGGFLGDLAGLSAAELGAAAIRATVVLATGVARDAHRACGPHNAQRAKNINTEFRRCHDLSL